MRITLRKPLGYTQIGRKARQEDCVWPAFEDVTKDSRCIVLCDGVGGSLHGEIASQTASKTIGENLTAVLQTMNVVKEQDVVEAIEMAYDALEKVDVEAEEGVVSMATTLTCVCIHEQGIMAAHMGDSRIYMVRPGQGLLYQSADHSLVNALLMAGELTPEEAKTFPRRNVITRALQPHASRRCKADIVQLTDVRDGDYLFLCCDGVLEQLTNERLVEVLSMECSDEEKVRLLEAESTDRTRDNYTAYLIPIDHVEGTSALENQDEVSAVAADLLEDETEDTIDWQQEETHATVDDEQSETDYAQAEVDSEQSETDDEQSETDNEQAETEGNQPQTPRTAAPAPNDDYDPIDNFLTRTYRVISRFFSKNRD